MTISGGVWGSSQKKNSGLLSLAMTPLEHTSNFYPGLRVVFLQEFP